METKGLLFIPDISGFTRFVNETEIDHSRMIIQELLEVLINSNQLDLEVSEIEGDAILFYRFGESPDIEALYRQVQKMFCDFHRRLSLYEIRRYCQCNACLSAVNLSLKIITHYGEFTGYNVRNFNKLIGKDIIVAHQLLKNDIEQHEYWLVTRNLLHDDQPVYLANWMKWNRSVKKTDTGEIEFHYTQLSQLKNDLPDEEPARLDISDKVKVASASMEYDCHMIPLFHASGNFNYRNRWQDGVVKVEEDTHHLPRVGMRCRVLMDTGEVNIYSASFSYNPNKIQFSETDDRHTNTTVYTLERLSNKHSRLTIDFYLKKNSIRQLLFRFREEAKFHHKLRHSMHNLEHVVKEIRIPREYLQ
ncbi:DUF2652 domain-containing protein [Flavihumibacter solisilvae]|uniref:DUF2652 domain-containing protein n=1 Tax=Flavihumibacter solisilvae TaxID=1349421 RepID=A0A0C1L6Y0_9BACT|nr:DUF2652 domain-containing protein [Flavihumibacter solisilvae]KIC95276.1 hypothetical protein OI18_06560 [Flavihumibacter solisilvae]